MAKMRLVSFRGLALVILAALALVALPAGASTPPLSHQTKLVENPVEPSANFGWDVATDGTTLIVGAPYVSDGTAHIYVRQGLSWVLQQDLLPDLSGDGADFGFSVAVDGNTAVVGAFNDTTNDIAGGAAYVFVRSGTTWSRQQKLLAPDAAVGDFFGYSVALSGDTVAIGAPNVTGAASYSGATYVFVRSGTTWSLQQKISPTDGTDGGNFGLSMALDQNTLVSGSPGADAAYVHVRSGSTWSLQQKLLAAGGDTTDGFGTSVALDQNTAVVGAPGDPTPGTPNGAAYVFARVGANWSQQQKLFESDGVASDDFGWSVAVSADRAIVGSPTNVSLGSQVGAAYVFDRSGAIWTQTQKVIASDGAGSDFFGTSVALVSSIAICGAPGATAGTGSGAAYALEPSIATAPALGRHGWWAAALLLGIGVLLIRRGSARRVIVSISTLLLGVMLVGCGAHVDLTPGGSSETGQVAEGLGPTLNTVTLAAMQDTTVRASLPDANFGRALFLDQDRTLIQFSQTAIAAAVGSGDYLVGASLDMPLALKLRNFPRFVEAYRLTHAWVENGATFNCANDANPGNGLQDCSGSTAWSMTAAPNPWASPATALVLVHPFLQGTSHFDITADVRGFLHGDFSNFGWMLKSTVNVEFSQFTSRESTTPPHLVLTVRHCTPSACNDNNPCTQDSCDATAQCVNTPLTGVACNDGNACTQTDTCQAGACVGSNPVICSPPDQCHSSACDSSTGMCVASVAPNGTTCSDGNACTQSDSCQGGVCIGSNPVVCASPDGCHPGVCNASNGTCSNPLACHLYGVGSIPNSAQDGLAVSPPVLEDNTPHNLVGGLGSAIAYTGVGNLYVATPDRGPNNGLDSYTDRYYLIELAMSGGTVTANLRGGATLNRAPGSPFTGLSSAFDATNSPNSLRLDPEGVRVSPTGTMFVSDEYGPFLYEFGADGNRIRALSVPSKFLIANPNADGTVELTGNTSGRQSNRGMEGLAISPDGTRLFGIMQSPLLQDGALTGTSRTGTNNRILEYDLATNITHEYLYQMTSRSYGVSEIVAINDHQFLVDERDGNGGTAAAFKELYLIDVSSATDISGVANLPMTGTLPGVVPVTKQPFLNMLDGAYGLAGTSFPEKIEGLAFGPDLGGQHVLVITNDNDFLATNNNNFYVFTIDPIALPGYQPGTATFSSACVTPSPVTCPGTDECHLAGMCRPDNAQCLPRTATAGTPTSAQTAGDCRQNQCDANGNVVSAADNTDLPNDNNQCTNDTCSAGSPSYSSASAGAPCSQNGGNRCDGAGNCVQCLAASDCPGSDTECSFRTCVSGACGIAFAPNGQTVSQQTAGDCHRNQCDGAGNIVSAVDDTDAPNDGNTCTNDVCTNGVPSNPAAPINTPCSAGVCDGNGNCAGCTVASQCPGSDTFCATRTCSAGTCGFSYTAAGTALPSQTAGDCKVQACDGAGNVVANNDSSDVPVDGNACTGDVCTAGVPSNPNVPYGTSCGTNLICNAGACVDLTFRALRIGDGVAALSSAAFAVFVEERRVSDGVKVSQVALPTAVNGANQPLTDSGSATSDGMLALSVDARYLTLAGYAAAPGTTGITGTTSAATNRVVGRIDAAGNVDTSTRFNTAFSANNIRTAISVDGSAFWAGGAGGAQGGAWYIPIGTTGGTQLTAANTRVLGIFNNQLYGGSSSAPLLGVYTIGAPPPPTSGTQTTTLLPGHTTASSYGFVLLDLDPNVAGVDTLYVADDSAFNGNTGGGIQKWTLSGGTWTRLRTFTASITPIGFRGVTAQVSGSNVLIVGSTADTVTRLVTFVDDGSPTVTGTTVATSPTNMVFRGVAFSPHN